MAAVRQPVLVLAAAVVLGCGYGFCLVFGLAEVQRLARPAELAGMTAVFQAVTYVGFGAPYLLSVLHALRAGQRAAARDGRAGRRDPGIHGVAGPPLMPRGSYRAAARGSYRLDSWPGPGSWRSSSMIMVIYWGQGPTK